MNRSEIIQRWTAALLTATVVGCASKGPKAPLADFQPTPLGSVSDPIWQQQEENAEASDFVIHEHEWVGNSSKLNPAGMEHVKQIASRAAATPFPVIIERSSMSVDPQTQHLLPVNGREDLDAERRNLIAHALVQMGVQEADTRVVVSPALTPGFQEFEGERAYNGGFSGNGGINGGFGGGGGGGAFGGLGGGFF